jgi:hypothetical protein
VVQIVFPAPTMLLLGILTMLYIPRHSCDGIKALCVTSCVVRLETHYCTI